MKPKIKTLKLNRCFHMSISYYEWRKNFICYADVWPCSRLRIESWTEKHGETRKKPNRYSILDTPNSVWVILWILNKFIHTFRWVFVYFQTYERLKLPVIIPIITGEITDYCWSVWIICRDLIYLTSHCFISLCHFMHIDDRSCKLCTEKRFASKL